MTPLPAVWYLIIRMRSSRENEAVAFSEGYSAADAVRNWREHSAHDYKVAMACVWPYDRTEKLDQFPSDHV